MAEKGGTKPAVSDNRWATTAPPHPITEPLGAKKDTGYATNEIPSAAHWNWLLWINGIVDNWLSAAHVREFADIGEAIAAVPTASDVFRIGQPSAGNRLLGDQVYSLIPAGFTVITDAASDGQQVYYLNTSTAIYACNPDTGAQIWAVTPANVTNGAIAADGRSVYVAGAAGFTGLVIIDRATGAILGRAGTPAGAADIAANGDFAVLCGGGPAVNNIYYYGVQTSTPVETGLTNHGNQLYACAVDDAATYFGGVRSGGVDVRAHDLATRAQIWAVAIKVGLAPVINSIATDGELVYVATARVVSGAGFANLFVLQATDGAVIATADVQVGASTVDAVQVSVDHRTIYVSLGTPQFGVMAMRLGSPVMHEAGYIGGLRTAFDCDGVGLIAESGQDTAERYFTMDRPMSFERVGHGDPHRRPFHKLAIPIR